MKSTIYPVRDFMSRGVISVHHDSSVSEALRTMASHGIGSVVVSDPTAPKGIFSERDLINRVIARNRDPKETLLADVMSAPLVTVEADEDLEHAAKKMLAKKGRLVVFEGGSLAGIVTSTDIAKAIYEMGMSLEISRVISKHIVTMGADETLSRVIREMYEKRIGSVLVSSNGSPHGIFSERDVVTRVMAPGVELSLRVGDFISKPLVVAPIATSGREVARIMAEHRIKRIPMVAGGRIVGIVTARDLVEALAMRPEGWAQTGPI